MKEIVKELLDLLKEQIESVSNVDEKVELLNEIRKSISEVSPLKHHPVDCVLWIKSDKVEENDYNPNSIAPPELKLLHTSISEDGYTMSIVTHNDGTDKLKIIDGKHRRLMEQIHSDISSSTFNHVPLTIIRSEKGNRNDRIASTIRHNRARGSHSIELMSNIVAELIEAGMSDGWIKRHIGMDSDELLRLKQVTGIAALFNDQEFSTAWKENDIQLQEEEIGEENE